MGADRSRLPPAHLAASTDRRNCADTVHVELAVGRARRPRAAIANCGLAWPPSGVLVLEVARL
jgi:hypothetical protein